MAVQKKAFENIVGKGENAGDQHFLLFPQCFSLSEMEIVILILFHTMKTFDTLEEKKPFENVGKE